MEAHFAFPMTVKSLSVCALLCIIESVASQKPLTQLLGLFHEEKRIQLQLSFEGLPIVAIRTSVLRSSIAA